jgi:protein-S-isoprenylcysteine O-methyltransferase Ste14
MMIFYLISGGCLWVLLSAITINFVLAKKSGIIREQKSFVDTATMLLFSFLMLFIANKGICAPAFSDDITLYLALSGTVIIIAGTIVNISGRLALKDNWGNQIRIYSGHQLITRGVYRFSRHPLYASIIAMIYGLALLYSNPLVLLLNTVVFIPFMIVRAKQEDKILAETFGIEYSEYKKRTRMFI